MGQEGYGTAMYAAKDLTDGYLLMEVVTTYSDIATQADERSA